MDELVWMRLKGIARQFNVTLSISSSGFEILWELLLVIHANFGGKCARDMPH